MQRVRAVLRLSPRSGASLRTAAREATSPRPLVGASSTRGGVSLASLRSRITEVRVHLPQINRSSIFGCCSRGVAAEVVNSVKFS